MESTTYMLNKKYGELKALFQPIDVMKKGDMMSKEKIEFWMRIKWLLYSYFAELFKYTKETFNQLDIVINNVDIKSENQTMLNVRNNVVSIRRQP